MNRTAGIVVGFIVVALIAGVAYVSMNKGEAVKEAKMDESAGMEDGSVAMKDDATIQGDDAGMTDGKEVMKPGSYEAYAPEKLAWAETGDVVLFFHASWCPSCRGLNADIEENRETIPPGVSILKVDYDTESELKKKYGVTYQHTLVQVDANGTMIKKWSGSPTLGSVVSEIE